MKAAGAPLGPLIPVFLSYVLSCRFPRHLLKQSSSFGFPGRPARRWSESLANLHLLFWLSLTPSSPGGWENFGPWPVAAYALANAAAVAYYILAAH